METRHSSETEQWKTGVKGGLTGEKAPVGQSRQAAQADEPSPKKWEPSVFHILNLRFLQESQVKISRRRRRNEFPAWGVRSGLE